MATKSPMDPKWLKEQLERPGRSQSALARYLGLEHPSIVNRMVNGTRQIKAWEADKIKEYLNVTASPGATIDRSATVKVPTSVLPVRGFVEAGSWRDMSFVEAIEPEYLPAPQSLVDSGAFALRVRGPSMDRYYASGSYVVVQPWQGGPLPIGKHVVVERERAGLVETTIKELTRGPKGELLLCPRSTHPAHQDPVPYDDHADAVVRVIGVVTWAITPV